MKKLAFFLPILLISCQLVSAQSKEPPIFGAQFGVNFSELQGAGVPNNSKLKTGITAGSFVNFPVKPPFYLESGLLYASKGVDVKAGETNYTIQARYLEVPFLAQLNFGKEKLTIFGNAGPYFGLLLDANKEGTITRPLNPITGESPIEKVDQNIESKFKGWDFGFKGSIGTLFPFYNGYMKISLSYSQSLPDIQKKEADVFGNGSSGTIQNSSITLSVAYGLPLEDTR